MKDKIEETPDVKSVEQLKRLIDRFGERQHRLRKLAEEQKADKQKIEAFARLNGINYAKAEDYALRMIADAPRLCREKDATLAEVIARIKQVPEMAGLVHEDYDSNEIKEYLATAQDPDALLAQLGLKFTEQQRKAEVRRIGA